MNTPIKITTPDWESSLKEKMEKQNQALRDVLQAHAVPDESIVGKLPRGGIALDYVGHAEITRILIEVDPLWYWEPLEVRDGRPVTTLQNGMVSMWGRLVLLGCERIGVGTVKHDKPDLDKELVSDFLRNAAMRYGIALSLWSKQEWEDLKAPAQPAQATAKPSPKPRTAPQTKPAVVDSPADDKISEEQMEKFTAACTKAGLNPITVFKEAKVDVRHAKMSDLPAMREAFNKLKKEATDASTTND
jgi:hypothetical protein